MRIFDRSGLCERCDQIAALCCNEFGEYWCSSCLDNAEEAAYERQQERDLESPPESAREAQLRTWDEHQKAHKR
jgi:hypothetical protein